ncbi:hypothetical protein JCM8202_006210 [Rhodotorula sphaerocarpa]
MEGYDADLVNLPERNTAAAAATAADPITASVRPSFERPDQSGVSLPADLPYASRALGNGHSFDSHDGKLNGGLAAIGTRAGFDDDPSSRTRHLRPGVEARKPHGRRRVSRRRPKRRLAWYEKPWFLLLALATIIAIGLGVGLSSKTHKSNAGDAAKSQSAASGGAQPTFEPSQSGGGGVQVSASNSGGGAAPTAMAAPSSPFETTTPPR